MSSEHQKQFIENLCWTEYGIKTDGTQDKSIIPIARKLKKAVDLLSKELYSRDIHFIFELIQNAEDNDYQEGKVPYIEFLLLDYDPTGTENCDGCLCIFNNEIGFTEKNIEAICGIGMTTKNNKIQGYIGEKGIGFKSVFIISPAPHIYSNGFRIKFMENDPNIEPNYIVPYWLDTKPEVVQSRNVNTAILLPIKREKDKRQKIYSELQEIRPEVILFLSKLRNMILRFKKEEGEEILELARNENSHPIVQLSVNGKVYYYWLRKDQFTIPEDIIEEKRENVKSREIIIAFPLIQDTRKYQIEPGQIFAFLPTEIVSGLPFLVNADFILSSSREMIKTDLPWNIFLRDHIADVAVTCLLDLLQSFEYRTRVYSFIPLVKDLKANSEFFHPICNAIYSKLKNEKVVLTETGKLFIPENTRLVSKEIRNLFQNTADRPSVLFKDVQFIDKDIEIYEEQLRNIGVTDFTCLELGYVLNDRDWLKNRTIDWLLELYSFLRTSEFIHFIKVHNLPIFLVESDEVVASSDTVYFFSNEGVDALGKQYSNDSTSFGYLLKQELSERITNDRLLSLWLETKLKIKKFSLSTYLVDSLLPKLNNSRQNLHDRNILDLTKLVLENWKKLDYACREKLKSRMLLLLDNNLIETPNRLKNPLVVPVGYDLEFGWHLLFKSESERDHLSILSEKYIDLKVNYSSELDEFFQLLSITKYPPLKTQKFTLNLYKISEERETYIRYCLKKFKEYSGDRYSRLPEIETWMPPSFFLHFNGITHNKERHALINWLNEMIIKYPEHIETAKVSWFYYTEKCAKIQSGLLHYLSEKQWIKSSKRFKKPGELFIENNHIRSIFGDNVPYLKDNISNDLCEILGIKTDVKPEEIIKYLQEISQNQDEIDLKKVEKLYRFLGDNWKEDVFDQFKINALIYVPNSQRKWRNSNEVMWEDESIIFVDLYGYLEPSYGSLELKNFLRTR